MPPEDSSTSAPPAADPDLRDQLDALLDTPGTTTLSDSHITNSSGQSAPLAHSDTRGENPAPVSGIDITSPPDRADHSAGVSANAAAAPPHSGGDSPISLSTPDNVEDLDAQLAMLTESLLSDDSGQPNAAASSVPAAPLAPEAESHDAPASITAAAAATAPAPPPAVPQPHSPTPSIPAPNHPTPTTIKPTPVNQAAAKVKEVATPVAARAASTIAPIGTRLLIAINKPLEGKSATVRDSLGWVGLWTLFNAVCIWAFVAFFQKPPELGVPHDAPHISSDDGNTPGEHGSTGNDAHDASASTRGKPSAKPAADPGGH